MSHLIGKVNSDKVFLIVLVIIFCICVCLSSLIIVLYYHTSLFMESTEWQVIEIPNGWKYCQRDTIHIWPLVNVRSFVIVDSLEYFQVTANDGFWGTMCINMENDEFINAFEPNTYQLEQLCKYGALLPEKIFSKLLEAVACTRKYMLNQQSSGKKQIIA